MPNNRTPSESGKICAKNDSPFLHLRAWYSSMCRCIRRACTVEHGNAWSGSILTINNKQIVANAHPERENYGRWIVECSHTCQHLILRNMRHLVTSSQCISIMANYMKRSRYQHEIAKTCYQPLNSLPGYCINNRPGVSMTPYNW